MAIICKNSTQGQSASRISHGPGFKSLAEAKREWEKVYRTVFLKQHPELLRTDAMANPAGKLRASGQTKVKDFISAVWKPERTTGLEENSRMNWEYYRDAFLLPFFGKRFGGLLRDRARPHRAARDHTVSAAPIGNRVRPAQLRDSMRQFCRIRPSSWVQAFPRYGSKRFTRAFTRPTASRLTAFKFENPPAWPGTGPFPTVVARLEEN